MRVVVAHAPESSVRDLRQALLGAGLNCLAEDCVAWSELALRLAQGDADLIVLRAEDEESLDWKSIIEATALSQAPVVAVGPAAKAELVSRARRAGALEFIDEGDLRNGLDAALDRLTAASAVARRRGTVVAVYAPAVGSGGTTLASNIAGAMAEKYPKDVGLIELARDHGDLAFLLNLKPQFTVEDVCRRWQSLDRVCLESSLVDHASGLRALVNSDDQRGNSLLSREAVRRIGVLARSTFKFTILALESRLAEEEIEAMRLSDVVLLVVRPDVPSVRRAHWALATALAQGVPRERFRLIVNRWGQGGQLTLKQIESNLGLKASQLVPDDPTRVNKAANRGVLLRDVSARSAIQRRIAAVAAALNGKPSKTSPWMLMH